MDINSWKDTWGTIDWKHDSEKEIIRKIKELYDAGVRFDMAKYEHLSESAKEFYDVDDLTPLMEAAMYSTPTVLELLIGGGVNPNVVSHEGFTALHFAAGSGKADNVKCLIKHGPVNYVNKAKHGWTAMHDAACSGDVETIKALLAADSTLIDRRNVMNETPFRWAVRYGNVDAVKYLLTIDPGLIEEKYEQHRTPLFEVNNPEMAEVLISAKPSLIYQKDNHGNTVLHCLERNANMLDHLDVVEIVLNTWPDIVNEQNKDGKTPLIISADKQRFDAITKLVEHGANLNIKDKDGKTALFYLLEDNEKRVPKYWGYYDSTPQECYKEIEGGIRYLIEHGADVKVKDKSGETMKSFKQEYARKMIRHARRIRKDYLKAHPEERSSLQKTLDVAANEGMLETLLKRGRNIFAAIFKKENTK